MSIQNNNITIYPISGYSPSFSWQVGFNDILDNSEPLTFRATIRPLHGLENFTRIPNNSILYEETGIVINDATNQGQWSFPLEINAALTGGPYRDYQVVIEAHDSDGNTSAGNEVSSTDENGWIKFNQGYDIIAVQNPRQTGIELSNNLPTLLSITDTGISYNSGHGYSTLNYMGTHGEINIRYLSGNFNSNLVGGYIYAWTGQFPKLETALGISGFSSVSKSQFSFSPTMGHIYHPTAAMAFRGANSIYISLSFYDNLDKEAIDNGIDISTGLYISDNAIAYNDIAAGSITIGGFQTIYSMQYTGNAMATGILGTGITVLAERSSDGSKSVLYLSEAWNVRNFSQYTGNANNLAGGMGGQAVLLNNNQFAGGVPIINRMVPDYIPDGTTDYYIDIYGHNLTQIAGPDGYGINVLVNGSSVSCTWGVTYVSSSRATIHIQPIPTLSNSNYNELIWLNNYNTIATAVRFHLNVV